MDVIIHLCDENGIDLEDCKKYLSPSIQDHLEFEAQRLNFLPKGNTLDV